VCGGAPSWSHLHIAWSNVRARFSSRRLHRRVGWTGAALVIRVGANSHRLANAGGTHGIDANA